MANILKFNPFTGTFDYIDDRVGLELTANKNAVGGYAGLDGSGKVASAQLPSYVDDVIEVANFAALPATGETGKIYVTLDTNFEYRWSGSTYIRLVSSPGTTDALAEGVTNLYFTDERAQDAVGAMVDATLVYTDATPELRRAAITGDVAVPAGSNTSTLATVVSAATVGDATHIPVITYDAKGRITSTSTATISSGTQRTFVTAMGF